MGGFRYALDNGFGSALALRDEVRGTSGPGLRILVSRGRRILLLTSAFRLVTRKQRVARPGKVGIHLGRRSIDVPSFDHRKDALMLIGDHLGIKEMTHLHLRHTQVRLADNQVMKALDSRAACPSPSVIEWLVYKFSVEPVRYLARP